MKKSEPKRIMDLILILLAVGFLLGCIATTHRTAHTVEKGQVSTSLHYMRAENVDELDTPVHLAGLDIRYGFSDRVDGGLMHTWDLTEGNEGVFATIWGDVKVQLNNSAGVLRKPVFSTGLIKGYVYEDAAKLHITSLPLNFSYGHNETWVSSLFLRYELIRNDFIPDKIFDHPRYHYGAGLEYRFSPEKRDRWQPKIAFTMGYFNSLTGDPENSSGLTFNIGFTIDSPRK